jgi:adenine-specific DNA-methyltransferase
MADSHDNEKLKMHSPDLTQDNIAKIRELFPGCVTEAKDDNGKLRLAVDFDQLKQELSGSIVEGPQERYHLNWPGKREALLAANAPIAKTLRPCRDESVNFDTTQNLFIEGDNLEALKLLQETYLGKVKMIYIDPPYNTGRDFIYNDDYKANTVDYLSSSNQKDTNGDRMLANLESNGRFHSDWLSMIYARLKIAKNLLSKNGVVFISIDDEEVSGLKSVCDEVFGQSNFIETFVWIKKTAPNNVVVGSVHEYVLMYAKNIINADLFLLPRDANKDKDYKNPDSDVRGRWKPDNLTAAAKGGRATPSLIYAVVNPVTGKEHWPPEGRMWAVNKEDMNKKIQEGTVYWGKGGDGKPMDKRFLTQTRTGMVAKTLLDDVGSNSLASKSLSSLFGGMVVFETPKPVALVERLLRIATKSEDIVLDFFSGSSVTADAVFRLNSIDGGNRKFISVQIPEALKKESEAMSAGYKSIADIGKERIRRAGKAIIDGNFNEAWNKDIGFRSLKIDTSNLGEIYYSPSEITQESLFDTLDNIKPDRTPEDLLFQVMIDWAVDLMLPIRTDTIDGFTVFYVDDNALVACFDPNVTEALVTKLAEVKPLRAVFRDLSFSSDSQKINVTQLFRQYSPHTDVKVL